MRHPLALSFVIACSAFAAPSYADLVAGWDFDPQVSGNGAWGPSPYATASVAAGVTAGGLTRGSGVGTPPGTSAAADAWGGTDWLGTSLATAIANGDFITFTLAPQTGKTLSLSSIDAYNVRHSATGASTGQWQYDVGSGFTDIGSAITWGGVTSNLGNPQAAISLTGITALQGLAEGTTVTFRIINWGATNTGGTWYLNDPPTASNDIDFSLSGTVANASVPEASTILFGTLVCMTFGVTYCKRKYFGNHTVEA